MSKTDDEIARRVVKARKAAQVSQEQVADALGLTRSAYGHYERGRSPWTAEMLFQLERILGVSVAYFLGLDIGLSEDEDELLTRYRALEEIGKEFLMDTLRAWGRRKG